MAKRSTVVETPVEETVQDSSETITIQGIQFEARAPYSEGHVLTEVEAGVLNQTYQENLRNNFASTVKAAKEEAEKAGTDLDLSALYAKFAEYMAGYQFGVRRAGGGVSRDPVMARAMVEARKLIRQALAAKGHKPADFKDRIDELAERYLAGAGAPLVEAARESLEREKAAAKAAAIDLDLDLPQAAE